MHILMMTIKSCVGTTTTTRNRIELVVEQIAELYKSLYYSPFDQHD